MTTTDRTPEPGADDEAGLLRGWLAFHRDALAAKCDGHADIVRERIDGLRGE